MVCGPEVEILSRGPKRREPDTDRQGPKGRVRSSRVRVKMAWITAGRLEAVGARLSRAKAKRRKAELGRWS